MSNVHRFATAPWIQKAFWKMETAFSGSSADPLPPHPAEDPGYWEMIEIVNEAWGRTCSAALAGGVPLDFEASFLACVTDDVQQAHLSSAGQAAALREIEKRLAERHAVLANARPIEGRCRDRGDLREVRFMWLHREAGFIKYAICPAREHGWLAKINIELDFARGGLGRRGLGYLTTRYPKAAWTTSGPQSHARGFWSTMQAESTAGWGKHSGPCSHGWNPVGVPPGSSQMRPARPT
jgi:hypothetical protein